MPYLNRTRRICVLLLKNYREEQAHYPVLYMHDGQNIYVKESYSGYLAEGYPNLKTP